MNSAPQLPSQEVLLAALKQLVSDEAEYLVEADSSGWAQFALGFAISYRLQHALPKLPRDYVQEFRSRVSQEASSLNSIVLSASRKRG